MNYLHTFISAAALCSSLLAQSPIVTGDNLVGWSNRLGFPTGRIDLQDVDHGCHPARLRCAVDTNTTVAHAGGTAYDPARQAVWESNGTSLNLVSLATCQTLCRSRAVRRGTASVTGLAYHPRSRRLFQLQSTTSFFAIQTYNTKTCPPTPEKYCAQRYPGGIAGGLAFDITRNLLYIGVSTPTTSPLVWTHHIYVTRGDNPCQILCKWQFNGCLGKLRPSGLWQIKGLAYNPCNDTLYATDGQFTAIIKAGDPARCQFKVTGCCSRQMTGEYRGLAVVPGWLRTSFGKSCLAQPCPQCPSMTNVLIGGDPALGTSDFAVELRKAPTGGKAILAISVGGCNPNGVPFLCGRLHLAGTPFLFPAVPITGSGTCDGRARVVLPIPADPKLCGVRVCAQWLVLCPKGGTGLSNAIDFTLAGL